MLFLGIDLGTSSVKLLVMDENGVVQASAGGEYGLSFPKPGWSEQEPQDWVAQMEASMEQLRSQCDIKEIAGISFAGQMHGLVLLDENDNVIRPAILWNDGRTKEECDYLNQTVGREKISAYTANMALTGFTAPKLLWVKKHEPENFARIAKIMLPKDYLAYLLSGVHCTDVSDASGMLLFDVEHKCWSKEMLELCGIKEEQLARIFESYETVGTIKKEMAERFGLSEQVKIIAGAGDNAAGAVGTGTTKHGMCSVSLGTSGTVFVASDTFAVDKDNALHMFAHANGRYHLMGCMLSAASSNKWWMDNILGTKEYASEQENITALGENHVYYLPYLMGERTPHNNPNARGTFIGMTLDTTRADMTQAVLEGVAFALRDSVEIARSLGVTIKRVRVMGGGAKSYLWRKMLANIMNVTVESINSEEGPGYGGAILAAVGCGAFHSVEEAGECLVHVVDSVSPEPELVAKYEEKYKVFRKLYPALLPVFDEVAMV